MVEFSVVPPRVEILEPVTVEGLEVAVVLSVVHLLKCLVEEVVKLVTAVVVTAAFAWALLHTEVGVLGEVDVVSFRAACVFVSGVTATSELADTVKGWEYVVEGGTDWAARVSEDVVVLVVDLAAVLSGLALEEGTFNWAPLVSEVSNTAVLRSNTETIQEWTVDVG